MSGPPAIDIGMYICAHGVRSPRAIVGVLATTPTILNHCGAGLVDGSVDDITRWSIGSSPEECIGERLVDDDDRLAPIDVLTFQTASAKQPHAHRFEVAGADATEETKDRGPFGSGTSPSTRNPFP